MPKFFVENNQVNEKEIIIEGSDVNHITNVLRKKVGDILYICDKEISQNYMVSIRSISKDNIVCNIKEAIISQAEPNIKITLFQGLPKADKFEVIIEKGTEIGVLDIYPVQMERTIVKIKDQDKKLQRWQKIAEVASKQSKRDIVPKINNLISFQNIESIVSYYDILLVAYEEESNFTLKDILEEYKKETTSADWKVGILIGPEGGISAKEIEYLKQFGQTRVVSLGKRILRTETAGIVMMSQLIYEFEF